jgi:hypothetical protein
MFRLQVTIIRQTFQYVDITCSVITNNALAITHAGTSSSLLYKTWFLIIRTSRLSAVDNRFNHSKKKKTAYSLTETYTKYETKRFAIVKQLRYVRRTERLYRVWPLIPKFAGSNPAEAVGFIKGDKNPQHAFLRKGSKIIGPMLQICGM